MATFGVLCLATGFVAYVGPASDARDACVRSTGDQSSWGNLGPFHRNDLGAPKDDELSWLELAVYDLGDMPARDDVDSDDPEVLAAMTEDNLLGCFIARQD